MKKRILGVGCVVFVAFAAACTSEIEPTETETIGSTSQAVISSSCEGSTVYAFKGTFTGTCNSGTTTTVDGHDKFLNHIRAQAWFAYVMGGPAVPDLIPYGTDATGNLLYFSARDKYWSTPGQNGMSTAQGLCVLRNAIAAGKVLVSNAGTDWWCSDSVSLYKLTLAAGASITSADATACGWTTTTSLALNQLTCNIAGNMEADRGWCPVAQGGALTPTFFRVDASGASPTIDPEPVTLNAGQTLPATGSYSASTNAAATGNDTGVAYAQTAPGGGGVFRWPSVETYAASTTQLATQLATKNLGVPCFTPDQTGTTTSKYIRKGMMANKYLCSL